MKRTMILLTAVFNVLPTIIGLEPGDEDFKSEIKTTLISDDDVKQRLLCLGKLCYAKNLEAQD